MTSRPRQIRTVEYIVALARMRAALAMGPRCLEWWLGLPSVPAPLVLACLASSPCTPRRQHQPGLATGHEGPARPGEAGPTCSRSALASLWASGPGGPWRSGEAMARGGGGRAGGGEAGGAGGGAVVEAGGGGAGAGRGSCVEGAPGGGARTAPPSPRCISLRYAQIEKWFQYFLSLSLLRCSTQ